MIFEACVETLEEASLAWKRGAHRIELCSRLDLEGLTPPVDIVRKVCSEISIPVMVMIRPRPGDFTCTDEELDVFKEQIAEAGEAGAAGVVFGLLTRDNRIDIPRTTQLAKWAGSLDVTFHKAIDRLDDPAEGVRILKKVKGITRILTSGGKETAELGAHVIQDMRKAAEGLITIVAAGRITSENRMHIASLTGARELHGRNIVS